MSLLIYSVGAAARPRGANKGPDTRPPISLRRVSVIQRADGKVGRVQRSSIHLPRSVGAAGNAKLSGLVDRSARQNRRHKATLDYQKSLHRTVRAIAEKYNNPHTRNQAPAGIHDGELASYRY